MPLTFNTAFAYLRSLTRRTAGLVLVWTLALAGATAQAGELAPAVERLQQHYAQRFPGATFTAEPEPVEGCGDVRFLQTDALRLPATGPLIFDHGDTRRDTVVLFHGLSDSPWFMCGIARALFDNGANVVVALLTGHGRTEPWPEVHRDDLLPAWKDDALAALAFARERGERVSVGGMSLGGVVAVRLWTLEPEAINGGILLFSAAFDFTFGLRFAAGCAGTEAERTGWSALPRRWCYAALANATRWRERDVDWVAGNPYRNFFSLYAALQLGVLRRETLDAVEALPFDVPLFVAHSLADTTAPIAGVDALVAMHEGSQPVVRLTIDDVRRANCRDLESNCVMPAPPATACGLPHASMTLATPILQSGTGSVCEVANPLFSDVATAAVGFVDALPPIQSP